MKVKNATYSASLKLFLGILVAGCLLATPAFAKPLFKGTFTLTNEVQWHAVMLGPGAYSLAIDQLSQNIRVISILDAKTGQTVLRMVTPKGSDTDAGDCELLISLRDGQRVVDSVRAPGLGEVILGARPIDASEKAATVSNVEVVPIEVAQK